MKADVSTEVQFIYFFNESFIILLLEFFQRPGALTRPAVRSRAYVITKFIH